MKHGRTDCYFPQHTAAVEKWRASLYVNFVSIKTVVDSIRHKDLRKTMQLHRIPVKLTRMVQAMCNDFEYVVLEDSEQTGWFKVTTDTKQGCVISGFPFLHAIRWGHAENNGRTQERHPMRLHKTYCKTLTWQTILPSLHPSTNRSRAGSD